MNYYSIFSVGDYQSNFAEYIDAGYGNKYYSPGQVKAKAEPIISSVSEPKSTSPLSKVEDHVKTFVNDRKAARQKESSSGTRKSYVRNVKGKAVTVRQSILNTGQHFTGIRNNPKGALLVAAGTVLPVAAIGGGAGYMMTRSKRNRR